MTKADQLAEAFQMLLSAAIESAGDDMGKVCVIADGLNAIFDCLVANGCENEVIGMDSMMPNEPIDSTRGSALGRMALRPPSVATV